MSISAGAVFPCRVYFHIAHHPSRLHHSGRGPQSCGRLPSPQTEEVAEHAPLWFLWLLNGLAPLGSVLLSLAFLNRCSFGGLLLLRRSSEVREEPVNTRPNCKGRLQPICNGRRAVASSHRRLQSDATSAYGGECVLNSCNGRACPPCQRS